MRNKILLVAMTFLSSLLGACAQKYKNVDVYVFEDLIKQDSVQLVDVRTVEEFAEGKIAKAINIDVMQADFLQKAEKSLSKNKKVAVYCRSGRRSAHAAEILSDKGYNVVNLTGGYTKWVAKGKPTEKP